MQLEYSEKMDAFYRGQHIEPFQSHIIDSGVAKGVIPFGSAVELVSISENYLAEQAQVLTDTGVFHGVAVLVDHTEQDAYAVVTRTSNALGGAQDTIAEAEAGFKDKAPVAIMKTGRVVVDLASDAAYGAEVFPAKEGGVFSTVDGGFGGSIKCIVHRTADANGLGIIEMFRV